MLYTKRRFTLPASAGHRQTCLDYGHTMRDGKGKCIRCGDLVNLETPPSPSLHDSEIVDPERSAEVN